MAQKQVWRMVIYIVATIAAVLHTTSCAAIPGFQECILNNQRYSIGEVFHPIVTVGGRSYEAVCYQCTCQPTTIAQCEEINCPPANCSNPIRLDGECCPICIAPEITTDRGDSSCVYDGIVFQSGESFHPPAMVQAYENSENATGGNPYCIECECYDGSVDCGDISDQCPRLGCNESEAVLPSGSCCKQCPRAVPQPTTGCTDFDGRFFLEGQSWHPTLPDHGVVTCINCTCVDNKAVCLKLPCPEVPPCDPDAPVPPIVLCCPECTPVPTGPPSNDTSNTTASSNTTAPTPITDISPVITPCQSPYGYKVYQSTNYDCMALENTLTGEVGVYKWLLNQTSNEIVREFRSLSYNEFATDEEYSDFLFVGWALTRRVNGLTTRATRRRRIEECTRNCSHLVVNILRPVTEYTETLQC